MPARKTNNTVAPVAATPAPLSDTERLLLSLSHEVVNQAARVTELQQRVDTLQESVLKLVEYVMKAEPIKGTVSPTPAPASGAPARPLGTADKAARALSRERKLPAYVVSNERFRAVLDGYIKRGAQFTDDQVATERAAFLRDIANDYLDSYAGNSTFMHSVSTVRREMRSIPQLRGTLNGMLGQYRRAVA